MRGMTRYLSHAKRFFCFLNNNTVNILINFLLFHEIGSKMDGKLGTDWGSSRVLTSLAKFMQLTSRMLSERSTISATPPMIPYHTAVLLHRSLKNGSDVRASCGFNPGLWTYLWTIVNLVKFAVQAS